MDQKNKVNIGNLLFISQVDEIENQFEKYVVVKNILDHFKELEMKMRLELVERIKGEGYSEKDNVYLLVDDESMISFKAVLKTTISLDKKSVDSVIHLMTEEEIDCLSQEWKLSESKYKKLETGKRDYLIYTVVTEKPATPTLEFKLPK